MTRKSKKPAVNYSDALLLLVVGIGVGWLIGLSVSPVLYIILGSIIALVAGAIGALVGLDLESRDKAESGSDDEHNPLRSRKNAIPINPLPLTMLVIGLGIGSCIGIYARTNDLFGPDPQKFARKWAGTGLDEKKIQQRLFDQLYPPKEITEDSESIGKTPTQSGPSTDTTEQNSNTNSQSANSEPTKALGGKNNIPKAKPSAPHQRSQESPIAKQFSAGLYALTVEDCQLLRLKHGDELRTRLKALGNRRITNLAEKCKDDDCLEAIKELLCTK